MLWFQKYQESFNILFIIRVRIIHLTKIDKLQNIIKKNIYLIDIKANAINNLLNSLSEEDIIKLKKIESQLQRALSESNMIISKV